MRSRVPLVVLLLCLVVSVSAQTQQSNPSPSNGPNDPVERAHQRVFDQQTDKAVEAGRVTAGFTGAGATLAGDIPRKNYVDEQIFGRIDRDGVPHSPLAGDEEFLRRVYLDATGQLPTVDAVRQFVASKDPDKRDKLIDSLIGTDGFADQWAWVWMDLLQSRDESFAFWLKQNLKLDRPYNEMFAEIVGSGATKAHAMIPTWSPTTQPIYNAHRGVTPTDPDNYMMNRLDFIDEYNVSIARVFLGINMDCFSCHDGAGHIESLNLFLASKTRKEFHEQAAFFGNLGAVPDQNATNNMVIDDLRSGYTTGEDAPYYTPAESRFPRSGERYEPAFILTGEKPAPGVNPRVELGRIAPANIQFGRAAVNLIWGKLMGVAFVEPYDGFDLLRLDPDNPPPKPWTVQPTNPWLLDAMAKDFKEHNFSMHHLFKTIMKSSAYQLSTRFPGEWKDTYAPYYARRFVRVLSGAEVIDTVAQATGRLPEFNLKGQKVTRVKQLADPADVGTAKGQGSSLSALMQAFFQSTRESPAVITNRPSSVQAMMMMTSPVISNRVTANSNGAVQQALESGKTDSQVIEELFLRTLSRNPTPAEIEVGQRFLAEDRKQGAEDIQWLLLNTAEFLVNH